MVENGWSVDYVSQSEWMVGWSSVAIRVDGRLTFQADLGLISNPGLFGIGIAIRNIGIKKENS